MRVIVAGDFCDCHRVTDSINSQRYEQLFGAVKQIIASADYSLVNFEFPIVDDYPAPIEKCGPCLSGQKTSIEAIKYAGFKCATLANNHILDQGEANCLNTKKLIEDVGIDTVGVGKDNDDATHILYKEIKGEKLAIINCCEHEFSIATKTKAGANALNPIQQFYSIQEARRNAGYVLVVVHGGHEHYQLPSPRMKETYRFFIDAGADAVVNHHQHCYSGYEVYKGKPIFYGIGNFLFDKPGKRNGIWNEGYMVELEFSMTNVGYNIIPYSQCDETPNVQPLSGDKSILFYEKIDKLNDVIKDDAKLHKETTSYYKECSNYELRQLEPYKGRVLNKLYRMGLLPRWIKGEKLTEVLNHIDCESHRDKLLFALKECL